MGRKKGSVRRRPGSTNLAPASPSRRGFTVLEILVALSVFLIIMGLVTGVLIDSLRALQRGEKTLSKEQRERICYSLISREVASLTKIASPGFSFFGAAGGFYFTYAQEDKLVESGYSYNSSTYTLEHFYQEPPDYDEKTYERKESCLEEVAECRFSYSDGSSWKTQWPKDSPEPPRAVRINFKFRGDDKERELVVNIPVSFY